MGSKLQSEIKKEKIIYNIGVISLIYVERSKKKKKEKFT